MSYVDLEAAKAYMQMSGSGDNDDVQRALQAASKWVDDYCNRTFAEVDPDVDAATKRVYAPEFGVRLSSQTVRLGVGDLLWVDDLVDIDTLEKQTSAGGSWETVDASHYELRPLNASADGEPYTHIMFTTAHSAHRFRVTGWFGWPQTPDVVPEATMLQTSFIYRRREAPLGISQVPSLEGGAGMRVRTKGDPNAESLLTDYVRERVLV